MPYVHLQTHGGGPSRDVAITTHDPKILAAWLMEQLQYAAGGDRHTTIRIVPTPIHRGDGTMVADWPLRTDRPPFIAAADGDVPQAAFVRGLQSALEAFLETL